MKVKTVGFRGRSGVFSEYFSVLLMRRVFEAIPSSISRKSRSGRSQFILPPHKDVWFIPEAQNETSLCISHHARLPFMFPLYTHDSQESWMKRVRAFPMFTYIFMFPATRLRKGKLIQSCCFRGTSLISRLLRLFKETSKNVFLMLTQHLCTFSECFLTDIWQKPHKKWQTYPDVSFHFASRLSRIMKRVRTFS